MTTIEVILRNNQYIEKYLKFMTFLLLKHLLEKDLILKRKNKLEGKKY